MPNAYYAVQTVPGDFGAEPRLVANIIVGRVEKLLERITEDGLNPMHGDLSIRPEVDLEYLTDILRFTWTPHE
ncbi:MAG: hypothetical protein ACXVYB_00350 [Arthrobacter sp.]